MIIVGGSYLEFCRYPHWDRLFGSGLRAALALRDISPGSELHTFAPAQYSDDVKATLNAAAINAHIHPGDREVRFEWIHPNQLIYWPGEQKTLPPTIDITADAVLRFGMLDGSGRTLAKRAVYSPQNEHGGYYANGSTAQELVIVLSEDELSRIFENDPASGQDVEDQLVNLSENHIEAGVFVVLLRNGVGDIRLWRRGRGFGPEVKSYAAESYFKIGSGDVLAAAFAKAWLEDGLAVEAAADRAARSVAWFVQDARLPLPSAGFLPSRAAASMPAKVTLVATETIEMGQLLAETMLWLKAQGVAADLEPTSSYSASPTLVLVGVRADLDDLLTQARSIDPRSRTVVFSNGEPWAARIFPNASVVNDYATALYLLLRGSE